MLPQSRKKKLSIGRISWQHVETRLEMGDFPCVEKARQMPFLASPSHPYRITSTMWVQVGGRRAHDVRENLAGALQRASLADVQQLGGDLRQSAFHEIRQLYCKGFGSRLAGVEPEVWPAISTSTMPCSIHWAGGGGGGGGGGGAWITSRGACFVRMLVGTRSGLVSSQTAR